VRACARAQEFNICFTTVARHTPKARAGAAARAAGGGDGDEEMAGDEEEEEEEDAVPQVRCGHVCGCVAV
jgi:hypothetical protein